MWLFRGGEIFSYGKFLWIQVVLNVSIDCFLYSNYRQYFVSCAKY